METQPIQEPKLEPKLELEREIKSPLLVYFFIIHQPEAKLKDEKCVAVMAYDLESAIFRAGQEAKNLAIFYTGQKVPIIDLIAKLQLDNIISPPTKKEEIVEIPKEKLNLENFKAGLLLAAEELIKVEEDKQKLKEIIEKLQ